MLLRGQPYFADILYLLRGHGYSWFQRLGLPAPDPGFPAVRKYLVPLRRRLRAPSREPGFLLEEVASLPSGPLTLVGRQMPWPSCPAVGEYPAWLSQDPVYSRRLRN